ncbi:hypothetical protein M569_12994, partial [Genlisea aurea]
SIVFQMRRGKIIEKIKRLQHIVPACSEKMGMVVMLEEVINYVRSLQNQVEFLSIKLTETGMFLD